MTKIQSIKARQVLDSRGLPTLEVDVVLESGHLSSAMVPSGASTGRHEALELRDGNPSLYGGKSVYQAVANVNETIAKALAGKSVLDQNAIDQAMVELDGTRQKTNLGANATLGVSLAVARAAADSQGLPLHRYLNHLYSGPRPVIPMPMVNVMSGGLHAGGNLDMQDFLVIPVGAKTYSEAMHLVFNVYHATRTVLTERGYDVRLVADEGGLAPKLGTNEQALALLTEGIERAGYRAFTDAAIAIDVASTHFWQQGMYHLHAEQRTLTAAEMTDLLAEWTRKYPVVSIEDGLGEDDWEGWELLTQHLGGSVQLIGDDLFTTSTVRLQEGISRRVANSILVKVNQIGTLSETLAAVRLAQEHGYSTVISARSGETEDPFLADLAVATGAGQIKIGSITRSERLAKYNRLFRIEEELRNEASFYAWP